MTELFESDPKALIVSNNVIEADDLTEMLTEQGLDPVVHVRDVEGAQAVLEQRSANLRLVICGLSMHETDACSFVQEQMKSTWSLLLIDPPDAQDGQEGCGVLLRPFSTADMMAVLLRMGLTS
ncbi:hypothetical protein [Marivita sp. XM-24bin2]|jgi:CheY-like chemotaxis protein|uniref:hypothetical protein n=1 Tax=unclassified Marivita TaxID=2632480 RepID=UPI000D7B334F|nr:hypothetical protein [Marivita sp. XM-24bin2]MCR9108873.1 hypothetical protein [Paracoccaceae bacterium]PWL34929.1 MAG: hypothetical protein DCO97_11845 [Marivita sp. XM-24bin2]